MTKKVSIKLENEQKLINDQELQQFKNHYQGDFYLKNEKLYLSYQDDAEGIDGAQTILKIDPSQERVLLLRQDPAAMKQDFSSGSKKPGYFKTAYGEIKLAVKTKSLVMELEAESGLIEIDYQVYLGGELNAEHRLKINYKVVN